MTVTKLTIKDKAAEPKLWSQDFKNKIAKAGDAEFYTQQIFSKWWTKGLNKVFALGAVLELSLDDAAKSFTWTIKTVSNSPAEKLLKEDNAIKAVATHKGHISGPKKVEEKPIVKVEEKPIVEKIQSPPVQQKPTTPPPKKDPPTKPVITPVEIKETIRKTLSLGSKDTLEKYIGRLERNLAKQYAPLSEDQTTALKALAFNTYFKEEKPTTPTTTPTIVDVPTLNENEKTAILAAMNTAINGANGILLDNDQQSDLGDAIAHAVGGRYPTHSRKGGHKGSFNKDKTIQQQLSNIGKILSGDKKWAINLFLGVEFPPYNV